MAAVLLLLSASAASAYGGRGGMGIGSSDPTTLVKNFEDRMNEQASILGISVADMKTAWAEGKNIHDIAKEKGISDTDLRAKMQAQRQEQMKNYLQTLVSNGSITQAQADARLKFIQDRQADQKPITGRKGSGRGQGRGNIFNK